jgi:hypothetical protein
MMPTSNLHTYTNHAAGELTGASQLSQFNQTAPTTAEMLGTIFRSVFRHLPTFLLMAIVGCIVARFGFGVSYDDLGVVVSIPMLVAFGMTRFLVLFVPKQIYRPRAVTTPGKTALGVLVSFAFTCAATATVMLPSAAIYRFIGLPDIAEGALSFLLVLLTCSVISLFLGWAAASLQSMSTKTLTRFVAFCSINIFWKALRSPTTISIRIFGQYGEPVSFSR